MNQYLVAIFFFKQTNILNTENESGWIINIERLLNFTIFYDITKNKKNKTHYYLKLGCMDVNNRTIKYVTFLILF